MRVVFFVVFILISGYLSSQDIHSFSRMDGELQNFNYVDSLSNRDLELALDFALSELIGNNESGKPDYFTGMLSKAIRFSFLLGNMSLVDSLDSVLMNYPKYNRHPIFQARIALYQAKAAKDQKRYIEALDYAKESLLNFQNSSDKHGQLETYILLIRLYSDLDNLENVLMYIPDIEEIISHEDDFELSVRVIVNLSLLFVHLDNFSKSQEYLSRAQKIVQDHNIKTKEHSIYYSQAVIYYMQKNYTKALIYFDKAAKKKYDEGLMISLSSTVTYKAAVAMRQKKYSLAEYYNREALKIRENVKNKYLTGSSHYNIANSLIYQHNFDSALLHIQKADEIYSIYPVKQNIRRGNHLLMDIYTLQNDYKNAYLVLKEIIKLEDSIYKHQNELKLNELESNIEISKYELQKSELQAKSLKEKSHNETNRLFIKISLVILIFSLIFSYLLFLHLREKNKKRILLINQKMIFIQMNSHFVFNALTAIQSLLFKSQIESAIHYLTIFSNLVRKVLFVTGKKYIGLQMEVSFIMEFLQLQKLRFGDELRYQIDISNILLQLNHKVPPLLLYPFIEYAVEECVQSSEKGSMIILKAESDKNSIIYRLIDIKLGFSELDNCFIKRFSKDKINCLQLTNQRITVYNQFFRKKLEFFKEEYEFNGEKYPSLTFKIKK